MKPRTAQLPVVPVLGVDLLIVLEAAITAFLFSQAINLALSSESINQVLQAPPQILVIVSSLVVPVGYMAVDLLHAANNRLKLPFAGSRKRAQQIYARRIHLGLLALYFNAILVALCCPKSTWLLSLRSQSTPWAKAFHPPN